MLTIKLGHPTDKFPTSDYRLEKLCMRSDHLAEYLACTNELNVFSHQFSSQASQFFFIFQGVVMEHFPNILVMIRLIAKNIAMSVKAPRLWRKESRNFTTQSCATSLLMQVHTY